MSRNAKEAVEKIFQKLTENSTKTDLSNMRLQPDDDIDSQLQIFNSLKQIGETKNPIINGINYSLFELDDTKVVCFHGRETNFPNSWSCEIDEEEIKEISVTPGYFLFFSLIDLLVVRTDLEENYIEQNILYQDEDSGYTGHTLQELLECFEPLKVFCVSSSHLLYEAEPYSVACYIYSFFPDITSLPISQQLTEYRELFLFRKQLYADNILLSMTSAHWKHCFLELYRCIEGMFPFPKTMKLLDVLKQDADLSLSLRDLTKICFEQLSWKANEREALQNLVNMCGINTAKSSSILTASFLIESDLSTDEKIANKVVDKVYTIRNQLVHQFSDKSQEIDIADDDWPILVSYLLAFWKSCYANFVVEFCD